MRKTIVTLTMVAGLASAACGGSEPSKGVAAPAAETEAETELTIVATDFGFDLGGVDSVAPGEIQLTLENEGKQSHEAQLYLLNEGATFEQFAAAAMEGDTSRLPAEALAMATPGRGVTSNVDPGESITVPAPVEAGLYAFVCHILDSKSLSPHYALGMMAPLEVG
jgi:hypothetical protein